MLKRGFTHIIDEQEFDSLIDSKKTLRIKAGFDPTAPDLHLGHAVLLRKLREFQDAGHKVVLIIGNTTALIGDPTGRNTMRPPLTELDIAINANTYLEQAFKILDWSKTLVRSNQEWFSKFQMRDVLNMLSSFTLSQMMARDEFKKRHAESTPIFMHELVYPMLQAYDSFHEGVDIELGGNDQFYNLMLGRMFMDHKGMKPQVIATVPLLLGLDGVEKMSKSKGNHIGITEEPFEMFSKVMSINDATMYSWWNVLLGVDIQAADSTEFMPISPMSRKIDLAFEIVRWLHSHEEAEKAHKEWHRIFSNREKPTAIPVVTLDMVSQRLDKILAAAGLASSVSEAGRLVKGGAVTVDGVKITDPFLNQSLVSGIEVKVGRKWMRITG